MGYKLDENDYHDVRALCEHFGIPLSSEYKKFPRIINKQEKIYNYHLTQDLLMLF